MARRIDELSARYEITPFNFYLTAFAIILFTQFKAADLIIGTVLANREDADFVNTIGPFTQTVPVRLQSRPHVTYLEAVRATTAKFRDAYTHRGLSFEEILIQAGTSDVGLRPELKFFFIYQNIPAPELQLPGASGRLSSLDLGTAKFPLTLEIEPVPRAVYGRLEYAADVIDGVTASAIAARFNQCLEVAAGEPEIALRDIPRLTEADAAVLTAFDEEGSSRQSFRSVTDRIWQQAKRLPSAIALIDGSESFSYTCLMRRVAQIREVLRNRGVTAGNTVALCLPLGEAFVTSTIAVLAEGAIYLALDPSEEDPRLGMKLLTAGAAMIVTARAFRDVIGEWDVPVVCIEDHLGVDQFCALEQPIAITADTAAYIIYTSGSTGEPKGVVNTHGGLSNRIDWVEAQYPVRLSERFAGRISLSFVDHVAETLVPLACAGTLVIASEEERNDPIRLAEFLDRNVVNRLTVTPTLLRRLADVLPRPANNLRRLSLCACSGEALQARVAADVLATLPWVRLVNIYGASEVSADALAHDITDADLATGRVPIGRPLPGFVVRIVDEHLQQLPPGVEGEITIAGVGVAIGYIGASGTDAARFFESYDARHDKTRGYRTGDRGILGYDGRFYYLGRMDRSTSLGGLRLDPLEVQRAVENIAGVGAAVIQVTTGLSGRPILVAYIRPSTDGIMPSVSAMRRSLAAHLPLHFIPAEFVVINEFPVNASGKLDLSKLPAPDCAEPSASRWTNLTDPIEQQIANVWTALLPGSADGIETNFFRAGGDSFLAAQLLGALHRQYGVRVTFRDFMLDPSLPQLATTVSRHLGLARSNGGQGD